MKGNSYNKDNNSSRKEFLVQDKKTINVQTPVSYEDTKIEDALVEVMKDPIEHCCTSNLVEHQWKKRGFNESKITRQEMKNFIRLRPHHKISIRDQYSEDTCITRG